MRHIKLLFVSVLLACSAGASAQGADSLKAGPEFTPHWFISAHGGAQYTLGEADFGDLLSPTVQLSGGYQFTPWLGARLSVGAWESKGGLCGYGNGGNPGAITYKYNYVAPVVDVMFNLSNAVFGYNPDRVFSLTAFVGGGANIGFGNDEANELASAGYSLRYNWTGTKVRAVGRGGLGLDFRLSDRVSLGLEGSANVLSDHYNSKKAGNADWYFNAVAGITIRLGKTRKAARPAAAVTVPVTPVEPPVAEEPAQKPAPEPQPEPVEAVVEEPVRRDVFFKINSSEVRPSEAVKVKELAEYLDNHKTAIIEVTGYADAGTGTRQINERLSARRADAVKRLLVDVHHVDASRIRVSHKGDRVQPFAENDLNRVSICIISN